MRSKPFINTGLSWERLDFLYQTVLFFFFSSLYLWLLLKLALCFAQTARLAWQVPDIPNAGARSPSETCPAWGRALGNNGGRGDGEILHRGWGERHGEARGEVRCCVFAETCGVFRQHPCWESWDPEGNSLLGKLRHEAGGVSRVEWVYPRFLDFWVLWVVLPLSSHGSGFRL